MDFYILTDDCLLRDIQLRVHYSCMAFKTLIRKSRLTWPLTSRRCQAKSNVW